MIVFAHAVLNGVEPLARLCRRRAVGQVTTRGQRHPQNGVARLEKCLEHRTVGLCAGMRLHVDVSAVKKLFRALNRQRFRDIDEFAAAIVALARIAFGVLVGHHAALGFHHRT